MDGPTNAARMLSKAATMPLPDARFYVEPDKLGPDRAILTGSAYHHLKNVRRLKPGDELIVFDGCGREALGVLEVFQGETAVVRVLADIDRSTESALELTIAPCLAKGKKIDLVIEKAIELGVDRICVVTSKRSIGRMHEDSALERVERWRRIAIAAAEQSRRTEIPVIERIRPYEEFIVGKPQDALGLVFTSGAPPGPPATLRQQYRDVRKVVAVIGPEGGLTPDEIELAVEHGYRPVGLGPRILRAETASIVAAAVCQHLWGDLGRQPPEAKRAE